MRVSLMYTYYIVERTSLAPRIAAAYFVGMCLHTPKIGYPEQKQTVVSSAICKSALSHGRMGFSGKMSVLRCNMDLNTDVKIV